MRIVTVCRSGPEYGPRQARYFHDQLPKGTDAVCLTDMGLSGIETLPLGHPKMPGWWAKMELFDPSGPLGDESFLYIDLDTKIVGDISLLYAPALAAGRLVMLRDFYNPTRLASGVMYVPAECKEQIWRRWIPLRRELMSARTKRGDGGAIELLATSPAAWQCIAPGRIISFKKHVVGPFTRWYRDGISEGDGSMPDGAVLCCYHGRPRPWG